MEVKEIKKAYAKVVAQAWIDDRFKQRLLADPQSVINELDLEIEAAALVARVSECPVSFVAESFENKYRPAVVCT